MRKKIIAFALVTVMTMCSAMTAFAAVSPSPGEGSGSESGNLDSDEDGDGELGDNTGSTNTPEVESGVNDGGLVTKEEVAAIQEAVRLSGTTEKLVLSVVAKDSADYKVVQAAVAKELKDVKFTVIDLKFESNKPPTAGTKITFPVAKLAEIKDAKYVSVYAVKDAKMELVDIVKVDKDGNFTFEPKHFSTYVFAAATEAQYAANVETGDTAPVALMITLAAVAAAGCAVVAMKKKDA